MLSLGALVLSYSRQSRPLRALGPSASALSWLLRELSWQRRVSDCGEIVSTGPALVRMSRRVPFVAETTQHATGARGLQLNISREITLGHDQPTAIDERRVSVAPTKGR